MLLQEDSLLCSVASTSSLFAMSHALRALNNATQNPSEGDLGTLSKGITYLASNLQAGLTELYVNGVLRQRNLLLADSSVPVVLRDSLRCENPFSKRFFADDAESRVDQRAAEIRKTQDSENLLKFVSVQVSRNTLSQSYFFSERAC